MMGVKIRALRWALSTKLAKPDGSWFVKNHSSDARALSESDQLLLCGFLLALLVGIGWAQAVGWLGGFAFLFVLGWFIRAAHKLEQQEEAL